jgi:excisionase family DNA binding protein
MMDDSRNKVILKNAGSSSKWRKSDRQASPAQHVGCAEEGQDMDTLLPEDEVTRHLERPVGVKTAARFLGVSASLVYAYVERKQIPHFRMMGRAIRFRLSELDSWRQQFHVNGGIDG